MNLMLTKEAQPPPTILQTLVSNVKTRDHILSRMEKRKLSLQLCTLSQLIVAEILVVGVIWAAACWIGYL